MLEHKVGDEQAKALYSRYVGGAAGRVQGRPTCPARRSKDLAKLELLEEPNQLEMHVYRRRLDERDVRFKVYRYGEPMMLSTVLPVLHSLGVKVSDERPYEISRRDGTIYVYDFGLVLPDGARELVEMRPHLENAFAATWRGEAEIDGFNELVVRAGLTWRQVVILRAYAKYLRQAGTVFAQESMEATFIAIPGHRGTPGRAVRDPVLAGAGTSTRTDRAEQTKELVDAIEHQLDDVASLDQDRILRSYLTLIEATLADLVLPARRRRPAEVVRLVQARSAARSRICRRPVRRYEIFVYSPRFEGVHLRFGPMARGGLRWSDRRDDFRTEMLGLVKAQMVKNAVIVPVGAKGGFVLKQAPSADRSGRVPGRGCRLLQALHIGAARRHRQPRQRQGPYRPPR